MTVREDAGRLLVYAYKKLIQEGVPSLGTENIVDETNWDANRINHAFNYIRERRFIKESLYCGNIDGVDSFHIFGLTPEGIDIVEADSKFKKNFSISANLLFTQFTWGASER